SGEYFARITDGDCVYLTETYTVTVLEKPAKPVVTVVSGELSGCEGSAEPVVLQAPEGFQFYDWSNGETTREITVTDADSYTVTVSNQSFNNGCTSDESDPIVVERATLPFVELSTSTTLSNGKIGAGSVIEGCESATVYFFGNGVRSVTDGSIVIRRDGEIVGTTSSSTVNLDESGTYTLTYVNDDINFDCEASSVEFTVEISEEPTDVPVLTSSGPLEFCATEGEVTLTAPTGFSQYQWLRNGSAFTSNTDGFDASSNTYVVRQTGSYSVRVGNAAGCYSPVSNVIQLTVRSLPNVPSLTQSEATCQAGPITFSFPGDDLYSYQLINAETGLPSGSPVIGSNGGLTFITSASVETATDFFLEVSYADGSGCSDSNPLLETTGSPNNVVLEVEGATLRAIISRWNNTTQREVRWYRNGVLIRNRTGDTEIVVLDNAEYSVEVDFEGNGICTATSNSIDLGEGEAGSVGDTQGRIDASSYPNPASGGKVNVDIKGNNFGKYHVNIMTLTGQVMISESVEKSIDEFSTEIDVTKLESGIYNMQVIKGNQYRNIRIVIQ
ncbi:MAG: T9SS type A sorting domain-containing protein, partial [Cyclobacteriaceae bacterium]